MLPNNFMIWLYFLFLILLNFNLKYDHLSLRAAAGRWFCSAIVFISFQILLKMKTLWWPSSVTSQLIDVKCGVNCKHLSKSRAPRQVLCCGKWARSLALRSLLSLAGSPNLLPPVVLQLDAHQRASRLIAKVAQGDYGRPVVAGLPAANCCSPAGKEEEGSKLLLAKV